MEIDEKFLKYGKSKNENFRIVNSLMVPHPYMITPLHIEYSDMYIDVEGAEKKGAKCGQKDCNLKFDQHEKVLLVECTLEPKDAKDEIHEYLKGIVEEVEKDGYVGFSFMLKDK